ncbi:MAG TPA: DUF6476 family protein [Rhizomicrobium sp.]|nr:DUF6476 family protein [Rhizomicrobium sp.]
MSDIQTPLEPAKSMSHRLMLAVVIVLGALIVIALGILVVGLVMRFSAPHPSPAATASGEGYALPAGAKVIEMQSQPNRLILHIRAADGDEIDIIDTEDGHVVSRIRAPR